MKSLVLNLFGGPGVSKSTTAAGVFTLLKMHNVNCEIVSEVAKDFVWDDHNRGLEDQLYVFGKQHHRVWRLNNIVDVIITDSPLLLSIIYKGKKVPKSLDALVIDTFNTYNNVNILLKRKDLSTYEAVGRLQTSNESTDIDNEVELMLYRSNIAYDILTADYTVVNKLAKLMLTHLGVSQKYTIKED